MTEYKGMTPVEEDERQNKVMTHRMKYFSTTCCILRAMSSAGWMGHMIQKEKELKHRARGGRGTLPARDGIKTQYYEGRSSDEI